MKYLFSVTALVGAVMAQTLQDLPGCGQSCIAGMLGAAPALGCGSTDAACLCSNIRFGYGIRDCVNESCPSGTDKQQILNYGLGYCQGVASSASAAGSTLTLAATQALGGGSGSGSGASATGGTVVPVVTTIVSDGTSMTSIIGSTTIFGSGASASATSGASDASASASSASSAASGSLSSASASASSQVSDISASASSSIASITSRLSSAAGSASSAAGGSGSGSSSGNAAPIATMAVQGAAGLVGLAAVMLL